MPCTPFLTVACASARDAADVEKDLEGILIHDDYAAYFTLKGVRHGAPATPITCANSRPLIDIEKEGLGKEHAPPP